MKTDKIDKLNIEVYDTRKDMGQKAANDFINYVVSLQKDKEHIRIIFAAAPSQNEFLESVTKNTTINWSNIEVFHMDEYVGLDSSAPQGFGNFLNRGLFSIVKPGKVNLIPTDVTDKNEICEKYGELLSAAPIDIVCMGIGENGHIAFNDPPVADFKDSEVVKVVELDDVCRMQQVNDGCFENISKVPTHAITLTIPTLMSGKKLFCMVPGSTKNRAVQETLNSEISEKCPSTILRTHDDCTLYLDQDSYGKRKS
jgi:glucosamine-6-phosphate deaminase